MHSADELCDALVKRVDGKSVTLIVNANTLFRQESQGPGDQNPHLLVVPIPDGTQEISIRFRPQDAGMDHIDRAIISAIDALSRRNRSPVATRAIEAHLAMSAGLSLNESTIRKRLRVMEGSAVHRLSPRSGWLICEEWRSRVAETPSPN